MEIHIFRETLKIIKSLTFLYSLTHNNWKKMNEGKTVKFQK